MKKFYVFLTLMLALCGFGTAQAADLVINELGEPVAAVSEIAEGDLIAMEVVGTGSFMMEKFFDNPTNPDWSYSSLRAEALVVGKSSNEFRWKVSGLEKVDDNSFKCKFEGYTGRGIRVIGAERIEADLNIMTTFVVEKVGDAWTIKDESGAYLYQMDNRMGCDAEAVENKEFKIYKPTMGEKGQTYKIEFQALDSKSGTILSQYSSVVEAIMGELVKIPNQRLWNYSFESISTDEDGVTNLKFGDEVQVTGDAVYYINLEPWPTIYFAFFNEAGDSLYDSKSDEAAVINSQCEPGQPVRVNGGVDGYYVSKEVQDSLSTLIVGVDVNADDTVNVKMSRYTHVTFKFVDASDETKVLRADYINNCEPGDAITYVEDVEWYTLAAADSMYIDFNYEGNTWKAGTEDTTIVLHYNLDPLPFEATTVADGAFAADTKWYAMKFYEAGYLTYNDGKLVLTADAAEFTDAMLWAFTGDFENGYCIYNKSVGAAQSLYVDMATINDFVVPAMAASGTPFTLRKGWNGVVSLVVSVEQEGSVIPLALNNYEGKGEVMFYAGQYKDECLSNENSHIDFIDSDDTSSIDSVVAEGAGNGAIYDLSGRVVVNPAKGIYIQNGKKVILK